MISGGPLQHFIEQTSQISTQHGELETVLNELQKWRCDFADALKRVQFNQFAWDPNSDIFKQIQLLNDNIFQQVSSWESKWLTVAASQSVLNTFEDKVMLLIFGKFNAGKSSLCNFLAACYQAQGQKVQYFYVQNEQIHLSENLLREGATETTAQLQGVCLGQKLVLLDTPGLHSATWQNTELTQKFIDNADGVLWLSSSTSPGQVQELEALANELRRQKPLLPIITRSDQIEEDELDGEICSILCNKHADRRALQETDVLHRAQDKLKAMQVNVALLKAPVSVSTQMARQAGMTVQAMDEAGFTDLFDGLLQMIEPALAYKRRKPAEILLHYLQEQILEAFGAHIQPLLDQLKNYLEQAKLDLMQQKTDLAGAVWRSVMPELPNLLEQHAAMQATDLVYQNVKALLENAFAEQVPLYLADYQLKSRPHIQLDQSSRTGYQVISNLVVHDQFYKELSLQINESMKQYIAELIQSCEHELNETARVIGQIQALMLDYSTDLDVLALSIRQDADLTNMKAVL